MVGSSKSPAFWSVACKTRLRFEVFRKAVSQLVGVDLPGFRPREGDVSQLSSFKSFCGGLIERRSHSWNEPLRSSRVSSDMRASIAHSLFLFRKCISSPKPCKLDFINKISRPDGGADPLFLEYLRNEVPRLFPPGWDRGYADHCLTAMISTSGCYEKSALEGGARAFCLGSSDFGWEEARMDFVESVLTDVESRLGGKPSLVTVVETGGKWRTLTVPPFDMQRLRPLHHTMYDFMSRYKWLLRGDAKPRSFKDFCAKEGEVFVSGDYESATDNLNSGVQKEILRLVLQNTRHVPSGIMVDAMKTLSLDLVDSRTDPSVRCQQKRGQMMGHLLSFPLLCIVNYLTFRWLTMDSSIPVKVNGDDIVFRATSEVAERWMGGVGDSGLVLSLGKTLVDGRYFTLNSCMFKGMVAGCKAIPFIRPRTLFGLEDGEVPIGSIAGRFHSFCPSFFGQKRRMLRSVFLRCNSGWIKKSCRSLNRGLGARVPAVNLKETGLWSRELRYLSLEREPPVPVPYSIWKNTPDGWEISRRERGRDRIKRVDRGLVGAFVEAAWKPPRLMTQAEYKETYFGSINLGDSVWPRQGYRLNRLSRLLKQSYAKTRASLRIGASETYWLRSRGLSDPGSIFDTVVGTLGRYESYYRPISREIEFIPARSLIVKLSVGTSDGSLS